jgi:hypothetical protein
VLREKHVKLEEEAARVLREQHAKVEEEAETARETKMKADVVTSIRTSEQKRSKAFVERGGDLPSAPNLYEDGDGWAKGRTKHGFNDNAKTKYDQNLRSKANKRARGFIGVEKCPL